MNKKELVSEIAKASNLNRGEVLKLLNEFSHTLAQTLAKGEKVSLSGFGTFSLSKRQARVGTNPRNPKEKIQIPPSVTAHFKPSQTLKSKIS
ncbi:MAG TPA: HU family DNA-binding protein [Patescibacteria group bacterium]|nr:HU family DNA-binding protein [Patescibacteria group bacterium]